MQASRSGLRARALVAAGLAVSGLIVAAAAAGDVRFGSASLVACTKTWDGGPAGATSGSWGTATNWSPDGLPGPADHVCIPDGNVVAHASGTNSVASLQSPGTLQLSGGTLSLTSTAVGEESTIAVLNQSAGTLSGAAPVTLTSNEPPSNATGGTQSGTGQTIVQGTLTKTGPGTLTLTGRTLTVADGGTMRAAGSGGGIENQNLLRLDGATIANLPGGTFEFATDGILTGETLGTGVERLVNEGTITKTGGTGVTGTSLANVDFVNAATGAVRASSGVLRLSSGGDGADVQSGAFGGTGGVVAFGRDTGGGPSYDLGPGTTFDGAVRLAGGTLTIPALPDGATPATVAPGGLVTQDLTVVTGSGPLVVKGGYVWQGGIQSGSGETRVELGGLLTRGASTPSTGPTLDARTLTIGAGGAARMALNPVLTLKAGATVQTLPGGIFDFEVDGTVLGTADAFTERFLNGGTLSKSVGSAAVGSTINNNVEVVNTGAVAPSVGTLKLFGGDGAGEQTGTFGGVDDGDEATAPGLVEFMSTGTTPPVWDLRDGTTFDGAVKITGGTWSIPVGETAHVAAGTTTQDGLLAVVNGPGTFEVGPTGTFDWVEGTHTGPGATLVRGLLTKTTNDRGVLSNRTLTVAPGGAAHVIGGGSMLAVLELKLGSTIETLAATDTAAAGVVEFETDATVEANVDAPPEQFLNGGLLTKSGGTADLGGGSRLAVPLVNTGDVRSSAGSLRLMGGGVGQTGRFGGTGAGEVAFRSGSFDLFDGATFDGAVTIGGGALTIVSGATASVATGTTTTQASGGTVLGPGTFEIDGHLLWLAGDQGAAVPASPGVPVGLTAIRNGGSVTRRGGAPAPGFAASANLRQRTLQIESGGVLTIEDDSAGPTLWNGARVDVDPGGVIDFAGDSLLDYVPSSPANPLVVNLGTIVKSQGTGQPTGVIAPLVNAGVMRVDAGAGVMSTGQKLVNHSQVFHTLTGGIYEVKDELLVGDNRLVNPALPPYDGRIWTNDAHIVLDGPGARILWVVTLFGEDINALAQLSTNGADGILELKNGKAITVAPGFTNAGRLVLDATSSVAGGGVFTNAANGSIEGTGTIEAALTNTGTIEPGQSAGTLEVTGSLTNGAAGTLALELGAAGHDQLAVDGPITLGGTLAITTLPGFTPAEGASFVVATGTSVSGNFATVAGADLPAGLHYEVSKTATSVVLTVAGDVPVPNTLVTGPTGTWVRPTALYTLVSDPVGATFECRVNGGAWAACTSPHSVSLIPGRHVLEFRATNATGPDASPEVRELRVVRPFVADWDANGKANVSVWRPSSGGWLVQGSPSAFFGRNGDVPVPGQWDADAAVDRAVWRPVSGGWYVEGSATGYFGAANDVPAPGQWDGDPELDRAVWRPVSGGWYVEGSATTFFGRSGDVPVPGDYDADPSLDRAVYRPSNGGWFVEGSPTVFHGLAGDVPVPADWNGDGKTDIAVFRPSNSTWYLRNISTSTFGAAGDVPLVGDFDADAAVDKVVFRPANGGWFVEGSPAVFFGAATDVP
jgi:hypothetical protein